MVNSLPFDPNAALASIPSGLRTPLLEAFCSILRNFREARWEPAELSGGKLCEVVYTVLKGHIDGVFPASPSKPSNMVDACRSLEQADNNRFSRAVRIQIPRMLIALYEIRNNRGAGHVGGDVSPNHMDAVVTLEMSKWIMADLVRSFHAVTTTQAAAVIEALVERNTPVVWEVSGKRRILNTSLSFREKMLVLLYSQSDPMPESDLLSWIEHSNASVFRRDVLMPAHKARLIEYNQKHSHPTAGADFGGGRWPG